VELYLFLGDKGKSLIVQARAFNGTAWCRPELALHGPGGASALTGGLLVHPVHGYVTAWAQAAAGSWQARALLPGTDVSAEQELTISQL
jgi:hypothetical protein